MLRLHPIAMCRPRALLAAAFWFNVPNSAPTRKPFLAYATNKTPSFVARYQSRVYTESTRNSIDSDKMTGRIWSQLIRSD